MPIIPGHTITRAQVLAEARSWIGTPYHHRAVRKGPQGGVDCAMLMLGVYGGVGYVDALDPGKYTPDWFLHRKAERYLNTVLEHADEIDEARVLPGDIALFCIGVGANRSGGLYAHGVIVDEPGWPHIIHATSDAMLVMRDIGTGSGANPRLAQAKRRFFTIWN